jgi:hypothetical protein
MLLVMAAAFLILTICFAFAGLVIIKYTQTLENPEKEDY